MNELTMGQRIAARRKLLNLSQEALAEHLEISRQAVSKWESDAAIPEIDKLIALSKLYNVSVGWLLGVEAQENSQSDELSESQLKMVEEIVKRYQPKPARNIPLYNFLIVLAGVIGIVSIFLASTLGTSATDYSSQIANLEASYSSIQAQIDSMDTLLKEQKEASKLLRTYTPVCHLSDDAKTVEITFYLYPKLYQKNLTAYLRILNGEIGVSQLLECRWVQGDRYLVHASLPLADNYQYSFLLVSDTGYEEEVLDSNTYFSDPLTHSRFYIPAEHPKYAQMKTGQSTSIRADETVYHYNVPINMPRIQEKTGFVPFRDVKIELLHNDAVIWEENYYKAFLELYKNDHITVPLRPEIQVNLPELREGDRLILQLTATTHTDRTIITRLDDLTVTAP